MQETRRLVLNAIAGGPVTGPALAADLGISRAAVWKHVEALRDAGFDIDSTSQGYTLESIPEYGESVAFGLDAPFEIEYHDAIASTNERARELAADNRGTDSTATDTGEAAADVTDAETAVVVLADEQTGGRGRLDRQWHSPSGGIWLSILVRPDVPAAHAPVYTLAAAVAVTRAVRPLGVDAGIKWPNDVLMGDRKLAGILTEMEGEADRISWLVVGIGLNANVDVDQLPEGATSLRSECGDVNRREVTQSLLEEFYRLQVDLDTVIPAWSELSATLGRQVRVETAGETVVGEAVDIEFPGALHVETDDGIEVVAAGDCAHLRSADR